MRFDFKDESIQDAGVKFPKFDLKKDEIARVCVISPYFEATVRHWVNRLGYVHCKAKVEKFQDLIDVERDGGRPEECLMCELSLRPDLKDMVNLPLRHFATYVLRYHTDMRGNVLHGQMSYHLEVWLLSNKKYRELMSLRKEWGDLQTHDLEINCVEAKYQNFDISLKKEALWAKLGKEEQKEVIAYVKEEIEKYPLMGCLGDVIEKEVLLRRFEVIRRKNYPDEEVNLNTSLDSVIASSGKGSGGSDDFIAIAKEDPFGLADKNKEGAIPQVVDEKEKKEASKPESSGLDSLIP